MNRKMVKQWLVRHPKLANMLIQIYNKKPFSNSIKGKKGNLLEINGLLKNCKVSFSGTGNEIKIGFLSQIQNTHLIIHGNDNRIVIDDYCYVDNGQIYIEDIGGVIHIGKRTSVCGQTHLACIEGCSIEIGEDCMFSSGINVRTGDSHSVLDKDTRKRINPSCGVRIDNHVWVGNQATILKGVSIAAHSIVATGAIVTKSFEESNVILAGNPAKIVKHAIDWSGQRI